MTRRPATSSVPRDTLPEFLRSRAIGAVIAEALDASTDDELSRPGAVTEMIGDAAREIRTFHDLPDPAVDRVRVLREETQRENADHWTEPVDVQA